MKAETPGQRRPLPLAEHRVVVKAGYSLAQLIAYGRCLRCDGRVCMSLSSCWSVSRSLDKIRECVLHVVKGVKIPERKGGHAKHAYIQIPEWEDGRVRHVILGS